MPLVLGVLLISGALAGCASEPPPPLPGMYEVPDKPVILDVGDEVEVLFYYTPELNVRQEVRQDGKIALQLVEDLPAKGMTPEQVARSVRERYAAILKNPKITVIIRSKVDQRVFVSGEVKTPGVIMLKGQMTVLQAIMQANGFDLMHAKVDNVVLIRHVDGKFRGTLLSYADALEGKPYQPVYLQANDIVYVSRTTISKVNQWVEQYVNRMIPRIGFFGITFQIN